MTTVGERVEAIKNRFDLNNVELAELAGVSKQAVGGWVNFDKVPSAEAAFALRAKLGVSEVWLISGKGQMMAKTKNDPLTESIQEIAQNLSPERRQELLDYGRFLSTKDK